jgi:hypothetical protein
MKAIRLTIFISIVFGPLFMLWYFILGGNVITDPDAQLKVQLTQRCNNDWEDIQVKSMNKYGVRHYGNPPAYCNDFQRNLKVYKINNTLRPS